MDLAPRPCHTIANRKRYEPLSSYLLYLQLMTGIGGHISQQKTRRYWISRTWAKAKS